MRLENEMKKKKHFLCLNWFFFSFFCFAPIFQSSECLDKDTENVPLSTCLLNLLTLLLYKYIFQLFENVCHIFEQSEILHRVVYLKKMDGWSQIWQNKEWKADQTNENWWTERVTRIELKAARVFRLTDVWVGRWITERNFAY